jgi:hypothetical protein
MGHGMLALQNDDLALYQAPRRKAIKI